MLDTADSKSTLPNPGSDAWHPHPRARRNLFYYVVAHLLRLLLRLYGRWKVVGLENVPREGGVLFASNHASYLDPILIGTALAGVRDVWLMGKREMWENRLLGWANDRVGGFPVKRHSADRAALRRVLDWVARGDTVAIFPEGERTNDGLLHPAQPGIALLVQKSGAPVVPVACVGTYAAWPKGRKKIRRVPLTIVFGKPLRFAPNAPREQITEAIMQAIAELLTDHGQPTAPPPPLSRGC